MSEKRRLEKLATPLIAILLIGVGALSWRLQLGSAFEVEADALSGLPHEIARWSGEDVPIDEGVVAMLAADYHVQRTYRHPLGGLVWLYVGYYGTERGGRPEHTPWVCYPSNGWTIVRSEVVDVADADLGHVNELVIEKDGHRRLVHFWYQSHRRAGMLGDLDLGWERLVSRLQTGRADGSLVRLSTPLFDPADEGPMRSQLISFGRSVVPLLRESWPEERRAS